MRNVATALVAVAVLLSAPAGAQAQMGMWDLTDDGQPRIDRSHLGESSELFVCPPAAACQAVAAPLVYEPGDTAVGTRFETRMASGRVYASTLWHGALAPQAPPAVDGDAIEGAIVRPVGGEWSGGWAQDYSMLTLHICRSQDGDDCRALPLAGATGSVPVSGAGSALLPAGSAGGYLFAADARMPADLGWITALPLYQPDQPYPLPLPGARTMISLPLGPVAPVGGTPPESTETAAPAPAAKPSAKLRKRAYRRRGRVVVGTITCPVRCRVQLKVGKLRRDFWASGTRRLDIIRGKRVREGRLKVTVRIDGTPAAKARVRY